MVYGEVADCDPGRAGAALASGRSSRDDARMARVRRARRPRSRAHLADARRAPRLSPPHGRLVRRDRDGRRPADGVHRRRASGCCSTPGTSRSPAAMRRPCCAKHVARVVPRALQGRAPGGDGAGAQPRAGASCRSVHQRRVHRAGRRRVDFARVIAILAQTRLPRLARRRSRAGSGGGARATATPTWGIARCARWSIDTEARLRAMTQRRAHEPRCSSRRARQGATSSHVTPESAGWRYVASTRCASRRANRSHARRPATRESCIVVLSGTRRRARRRRDVARHRRARERVRGHRAARRLPAAGQRLRGHRAHAMRRSRSCSRAGARQASRRALIEPATMRRIDARHGTPTRATSATSCRRTEPAESLLVVEVHHAAGPLVELSAAQARHRCAARRELARGNLLSPARSAAGLRVPARLHRRPQRWTRRWPSRTATS